MGILKVYNGSSWVTAIGKVWTGSAWSEKMNFFNGTAQVPLYPTGGGPAKKLDTTITAVEKTVDTTKPSQTAKDLDVQGFDAGSDYYGYTGTFGSIGTATYTDGDSNSRTIDSCYYCIFPNAEILHLSLAGINIPNTDATFTKIVIGGVDFLRSAASYDNSNDGGTQWAWYPVASSPLNPASNPHTFEVWAD